jgi:hypothetical protein
MNNGTCKYQRATGEVVTQRVVHDEARRWFVEWDIDGDTRAKRGPFRSEDAAERSITAWITDDRERVAKAVGSTETTAR